MKINDLQPVDLYGDLNMTFQQSIDMAKRDAAERVSQKPVSAHRDRPVAFWLVKAIAALTLMMFLMNLLIGVGAGSDAATLLVDTAAIGCSALILVTADAIQRQLVKR